ncbi:multidrug effflux MFS transporter [Ramlibacter sp. H39-3-26]|uniref:multidrug effflux MFS transporter n=1 Tax=Curvibacter soli TaxID=3031331 RepID=UPI0023DAAFC6|nr:multidrug effflux MFS transporter [Ramlibacter sp. H39-3-26]MDF1485532.1 multidrug effflux MFS transporter [Ramlibacter sp. H39-3-26]
MPPHAGAHRRHAPLWALALVTFSGTLAMHIFVPALPLAAADLGSSPALMQMSISVYIFGLALGQLVYGPLADRYGRRPMLLVGLALYTVAGLASALAPSAHALIVARLLQALGGCAGLVLGRAIVRDTALPQEAARRLALMNLMVTVGPGVAPLIGGLLAPALGWRAILAALCVLGMVGFICTWRLIPETGTPGAQVNTRALARHYRQLLGSPVFLGYALGGGCATTAMYAFIAAAPFIFAGELHRPPHKVGLYLSILVSGVWLGSMLASRLVTRVRMGRMLVSANAVSVLAAFVLLGAVLAHHLSVPLVVVSMFFFTLGSGVAAPAALTQALSVNPHVTGSASGLYGFAQMSIGALCTVLAGIGPDPALAAALTLAGAGVVSQAAFWVAARAARSKP